MPLLNKKDDRDFLESKLDLYKKVLENKMTYVHDKGKENAIQPEYAAYLMDELDDKNTIFTHETFEFDKEDLLVFVFISYGDYFRLKSNKGRVLEVGWLKDGIVYEEEIEGSEKVDEDDSWLHEGEYYDSEGKLRNLEDLL